MAQEKCSTSSQTVLYQITPTISMTDKTTSLMETEQTPFMSINIVTSPTAPAKCNNQPLHHPPKPTPYKPRRCPRWGWGTNLKQRRCPRWGWGTNPKQSRCPRWGRGTNPKQRRWPRWGQGINPK